MQWVPSFRGRVRHSNLPEQRQYGYTGRTATSLRDKRLPVTLLSGFLGAGGLTLRLASCHWDDHVQEHVADHSAVFCKHRHALTCLSVGNVVGKTTLLRHLLVQSKECKIAVIVNDMAELNIDAALLKNGSLVQVTYRVLQQSIPSCSACWTLHLLCVKVRQHGFAGLHARICIHHPPQSVDRALQSPLLAAEDEKLPASQSPPVHLLPDLAACAHLLNCSRPPCGLLALSRAEIPKITTGKA